MAVERTVHLDTITENQGFVVTGDYGLGFNAAPAGDLNGDGIDDLLLSDPSANAQGGTAIVIYGKAGGVGNVDMTGFTAAQGFIVNGTPGLGQLGMSGTGVGDVDGDGIDDLLLGASHLGGAWVGQAGLIFGVAGERANLDWSALQDGATNLGTFFTGIEDNARAGEGVGAGGDMNGDGLADLLIGQPYGTDPTAFVVLGDPGLPGIDDATLDPDAVQPFALAGFASDDPAGNLGRLLNGLGDINGDGLDDAIIGEFLRSDGADWGVGAAHVVFGSAGFGGTTDLGTMPDATGFTIFGIGPASYTGTVVDGAGDVNGDGYDDILIATMGNVPGGGVGSGGAWVIFGHDGPWADIDLATLPPEDGFLITSSEAQTRIGWSGAGAGDLNGDGYDDLILAGDNAMNYRWVVYGGRGTPGSTLDLANLAADRGFVFTTDTRNLDEDRVFLNRAGDLNGDGIGDVVIGGPNGDWPAGKAFVFYGERPDQAVRRVGAAADQAIFGGRKADELLGKGGDDWLDGGRRGDLLDGGTGTDTASYRAAGGGVTVSLARGRGTRGEADGDRLKSIENLVGSAHDDRLIGNGADNRLFGGAGGDLLKGGSGTDTADYGGASGGVEINLAAGTARGGDAEGDRLNGIENLFGGSGDDSLTGNDADNLLVGGAGDDVLKGGRGNDRILGGAGVDTLDGGKGTDTLDFSDSRHGVWADLEAGTASGGPGVEEETFARFEALVGSRHGDALAGDGGDNRIEGGGGTDDLRGRGGADVLAGGAGNDWFQFDTADSTHATRDTILDFSDAEGDRIVINVTGGGQVVGALTGTANDVIAWQAGGNTFVACDVDGNGVLDATDFELRLIGLHTLDAGNILFD